MGFSRPEYRRGLPCPPPGIERSCASYISCIGRRVLYHEHHLGSPKELGTFPQRPRHEWVTEGFERHTRGRGAQRQEELGVLAGTPRLQAARGSERSLERPRPRMRLQMWAGASQRQRLINQGSRLGRGEPDSARPAPT